MEKFLCFLFYSLLLILPFYVNGQPQQDSIKKYQNLELQVEKLTDQVGELEKTKEQLIWIGVPIGSLTVFGLLYLAWLRFLGIRKLVGEEVQKAVNNELKTHPALARIIKESKLQGKPILILSQIPRVIDFENFLKQHGFSNIKSKAIEKLKLSDINDFDLIFFNNENGEINQVQMNKVAEEYKEQVKFFYFNQTGIRWEGSKEVKMAGFANSRETLPNRLFEALK